jgi:hypothetical protein
MRDFEAQALRQAQGERKVVCERQSYRPFGLSLSRPCFKVTQYPNHVHLVERKWSDAIAVGRRSFVEQVQEQRPGCGAGRRYRDPQGYRCSENRRAQVRGKRRLGDDVDATAKEFFDVLLNCDDVEEAAAGVEVDQEVEIAPGPRVTASAGSARSLLAP